MGQSDETGPWWLDRWWLQPLVAAWCQYIEWKMWAEFRVMLYRHDITSVSALSLSNAARQFLRRNEIARCGEIRRRADIGLMALPDSDPLIVLEILKKQLAFWRELRRSRML